MQSESPEWCKRRDVVHELCQRLRQHIVPLEVVATVSGKPQIALFSGFLVERQSLLFWITAAHCIEHLKALTAHGEVEVVAARWHDQCAIAGAGFVPTDLSHVLQLSACESQTDVGLVLPRLNAQCLFRKNSSLRPLAAAPWDGQGDPQSGYCILGLPDEVRQDTIEETHDSWVTSFDAKIAYIVVERCCRRTMMMRPIVSGIDSFPNDFGQRRVQVSLWRADEVGCLGDGRVAVQAEQVGVGRRVIESSAVVNATGQETKVGRMRDPLVSELLSSDMVSEHPLGGLRVDSRYLALRANGVTMPSMYVIGSMTFGSRCFVSAVFRNVQQASVVAREIAYRVDSRRVA